MSLINLTLGPLTFLAPLALIGLIALPLIWWLLRVTPPTPKKQTFPPLRILKDVMTEEETPNSTPLWLLLFRLILVALVAIALARPILFKPEGVTERPLALIIDDGWGAATNWNLIIKEAENRVADARRKNVEVLLATSTQDISDLKFETADEAMKRVKSLQATPLPANYQKLSDGLKPIDLSGSETIWLSGGIDHAGSETLSGILKTSNSVERLSPLSDALPLIPGQTEETAGGFRSVWHRPDPSGVQSSQITAHGADGSVIGRADIEFGLGDKTAEATFEIPSELRSRITALKADKSPSAASVKLLDDSWGRPLIGVLTPERDEASQLLSEPFYAATALDPHSDLFTGTLNEILSLGPTIIVMPDAARSDNKALTEYVETGGLLIRFAGPKLAKRPDNLLPVRLREGGRELGGALTWEDPQRLEAFGEDSPFFGLSIPEDITVNRQVMAEPGADTDARTWARLEDGSPVVTSSTRGFGRIVLFHVTASPEWSNLPVGGLYVDMLRRLLSLARSKASDEQAGSGDWAPERVLNGFGRLTTPSIETLPITDSDFDTTTISLEHPPGLYRQGARRKALNTVTDAESVTALGNIAGIPAASYGQTQQRSLTGLLLGLALALLVLDAIFAIFVSGRLGYLNPSRRALASIAIAGIFVGLTTQSSHAQATDDALGLYLAYIKTGDNRVDDMSGAAMEGLVDALTRRTTIEPDGVRGVDPESDPLVFYPFLYWPVDRNTPEPTDKVIENLNDFMSSGGTLVIDTQDAGDRFGNLTHPGLARVTEKLDVPALVQVPEDHVLTKSFYLLQVFPGRWANGPVWVDRDTNGAARDGVSSVVIGSNDWAAGWAIDEDGNPIQSLERDIPKQQEMSLRFGVNLAMYALAGNYKSDQVHSAALIERLGKVERQPENLGRDLGDEP